MGAEGHRAQALQHSDFQQRCRPPAVLSVLLFAALSLYTSASSGAKMHPFAAGQTTPVSRLSRPAGHSQSFWPQAGVFQVPSAFLRRDRRRVQGLMGVSIGYTHSSGVFLSLDVLSGVWFLPVIWQICNLGVTHTVQCPVTSYRIRRRTRAESRIVFGCVYTVSVLCFGVDLQYLYRVIEPPASQMTTHL